MLEKSPYQNYTLDEDKDPNTEVIRIRLNREERAMLNEIKEDLNIQQDGKALKLAALIGKNVLQSQFTRPILRYLFKKERARLEPI